MPRCARLDVVVGRLQELEDDVLDILADIARFGQRGRVGHGEGHIENARERLREQGLARTGRPDQQDVGLRQFNIAVLARVIEPLVVVVNRHRQNPLGLRLADHVIVKDLADLARGRNAVLALDEGGLALLADDVHAQFDAFVADEHGRSGDQLAHFMLALAAEGAIERVLGVAVGLGHRLSPIRPLVVQSTAQPKQTNLTKRSLRPRHGVRREIPHASRRRLRRRIRQATTKLPGKSSPPGKIDRGRTTQDSRQGRVQPLTRALSPLPARAHASSSPRRRCQTPWPLPPT